MNEQHEQRSSLHNEQKEQSPSEKLQDVPPVGSQIPGTENPESKEIKREINPNTE